MGKRFATDSFRIHFGRIRWTTVLAAVFALSIISSPFARGADSAAVGAGLETATFAGGCFWCMQPAFDKVPGVVKTVVGYTGGDKAHPTYEEVSAGGTGHAESIEITFNPKKVSYQHLLDIFWHNVDPTTSDREFCDVGNQYRSEIFYHDAIQERLAKESESRDRKDQNFQRSDRDPDRARDNVLARRGLPSGLRAEKSGSLQILSLQLRPRRAAARVVGSRERRPLS